MSILDPVSDIYISYLPNTYDTNGGSNFLARSKLDPLLSDGLGSVRVIESGIFSLTYIILSLWPFSVQNILTLQIRDFFFLN